MEDWKKTKCGTCIFQRGKPICNSCSGYRFYRPMSNADRIRAMSDAELAEFLYGLDHYWDDGQCILRINDNHLNDYKDDILDWLQSEAE